MKAGATNVIVYPELYGVHGIARYVQSYLEHIGAEEAEKTILITIPAPSAERRPDKVKVVEIPMRDGRLGLMLWTLAVRRELKRIARETTDLTVNYQVPPLVPALVGAPNGITSTVTAHTTYRGMSGQYYGYKYFRGQWSAASILLKELFERIIFSRAATVITLTQQGVAELKWYGREQDVAVIPNGVDRSLFREQDGTAASPGAEYDVLFVGRIERRKGSRPLVAVCRKLAAGMPGIRIGIVGYGDDLDLLTRELSPLPQVTLLGRQSFRAVVDFYRSARVYASTSYYEGLPGTCLEAMAMGLPAVVWDLPFYEGLVKHEHSGLTVPVDDTDAFCAAISRLLADEPLANRLGQQGRLLVEDRYDWAKLATRVSAAMGARR